MPGLVATDFAEHARGSTGPVPPGPIGSPMKPQTSEDVATIVAESSLHVFLSLIVSIYLLVDTVRVNRMLMSLVPWNRREQVAAVSEEIHRQACVRVGDGLVLADEAAQLAGELHGPRGDDRVVLGRHRLARARHEGRGQKQRSNRR